ncbi:hypothetical protein PAXRUDRAFT_836531 [Paxillus rubicundulus Ve08.2h10]|uniref:Unplaced genomic scaffold scaffold_6413, whole genome shotgun sequence n=1 Tax=Paxillus rubicundulus Ve08.2h10 TaxID=930991 RepID=A0A0D0BKA7_9AGAM|nr:hypothetical protein PAXRUDRAFT_836531 [Paxillus rubicundulus Ve08.2h10]
MPKNTGPKASWSDKEVKELVLYLHNHHSAAGDGGSFTDSTFNAAAEHLVPYWKSGPPKTGKMVKAKWMVLQKIYTVIETYRGLSGCHWDSANGCSIQGKDMEAVWEEYVKHMQDIIPTGARGSNAFTLAMGVPAAEVMDEPGPQPQPLVVILC